MEFSKNLVGGKGGWSPPSLLSVFTGLQQDINFWNSISFLIFKTSLAIFKFNFGSCFRVNNKQSRNWATFTNFSIWFQVFTDMLHKKFSTKVFFSTCDQFRRILRIWWSHLLNTSLMENFIFCSVTIFHKLLKSQVAITNYSVVKTSLKCQIYDQDILKK